MRKQFYLLSFFSLLITISYSQPKAKQNYKNVVYLKTYETNNLQVQIWGYNKDKEFIPHGSVTTYYSNKQKATQGNYKNGKADGKWTMYYENGKTKTSAVYSNGLLNGKLKTYYNNGAIASTIPYIKGTIEGNATHYDKSGKKRSEVAYKNRKVTSLRTYKGGLPARQLVFFDEKPTKAKDEIQFGKICAYEGDNIKCVTVNEFINGLLAGGMSVEQVTDLMQGLNDAWAELGLKGDVMVQCANGVIGVSDIGSPGNPTSTSKGGIPDLHSAGSAFKDKVEDECSQAILNQKLGEKNPKFTGDKLAGPDGKSPKQNLIDEAKSKMDKMAKDCKDGGNSMIEMTGLELAVGLTLLVVAESVGPDIRAGYLYIMGHTLDLLHEGWESFHDNFLDETQVSPGRYVSNSSEDANLERTRDENTGMIMYRYTKTENGIEKKWTVIVQDGKTTSMYYENGILIFGESRDGNGNVTSTFSPSTQQWKQTSGSAMKSGFEQEIGDCVRIKSAWEKLKAMCEESGWQNQKCIEMVYFMNGCPIDLTITDPLPEDGLYFACGNANIDPAQIECENDQMIWASNAMPDGINSQSECINRNDISKGIKMGYDPCGPEVQPTDDQGCHPVVGVPSERGPKPSPSGNPIAAPRFQNNRFNTFAEYVQHNKYMTNLNTSNSKTLAALKSKQIGDENYSKITVTPAKKSVIVFYSSTCEPSMKYLSSIQSNLTSIEINASLSICDIEQNPELRQQYGIEYTPTTVVIGNNKITMKVSGANKLPEVQKAIE